MWLDRPISINTDLIVCITGLSLKILDPEFEFFDKKKEKSLTERMKDKFHTF
jgi:hypothetical protein